MPNQPEENYSHSFASSFLPNRRSESSQTEMRSLKDAILSNQEKGTKTVVDKIAIMQSAQKIANRQHQYSIDELATAFSQSTKKAERDREEMRLQMDTMKGMLLQKFEEGDEIPRHVVTSNVTANSSSSIHDISEYSASQSRLSLSINPPSMLYEADSTEMESMKKNYQTIEMKRLEEQHERDQKLLDASFSTNPVESLPSTHSHIVATTTNPSLVVTFNKLLQEKAVVEKENKSLSAHNASLGEQMKHKEEELKVLTSPTPLTKKLATPSAKKLTVREQKAADLHIQNTRNRRIGDAQDRSGLDTRSDLVIQRRRSKRLVKSNPY